MHAIKSLFIFALALLVSCAPKVAKETTSVVTTTTDFRKSAPNPGPAREVKIGTSTIYTLSNGLNVIVVENHKLPRVSYQLTIDRDPVLEKEKSGMTEIMGSLLAAGTTTRTKAEIDDAVDYLGASISTNANGGFATSLTKHTDKILSLFADVMLKPSFPAAEFEKIKTQTLSGLQTEKDDPNAISGNVSNALTFGKDHPYGEITNEITVSSVTLQDCIEYYNSTFKPGSAYLVIVGDIKPEAAKEKAEKYFGSWTGGKVSPVTYATPKPVEKTSVAFVDKAGAVQSVVNIMYPIDLKPGAPDVLPAKVMMNILGGGFGGRLFKNLREDKAYTYGAYASIDVDELIADFSANASVRNEVTDSAIHQLLYELNRLRTEPVTQAELDQSRSVLAGEFARTLESPQTVATFALQKLMYQLPDDYFETYLKRLAAVTIDDITRVANKYIQPDRARIIVVGNKSEVMDKLTVFDKEDGQVQQYDVYANPKKDESAKLVNVNPQQIIEDYLKAIGGREKLSSVKSMDNTYTIDMTAIMGMTLTFREVIDNGKYYSSLIGQGMHFVKEIFDGTAGIREQMGQRAPMEEIDIAEKREDAHPFPELMYRENGYKLEVTDAEEVNGKPAYKLSITKPSGVMSEVYFDFESHLKVKEIKTEEAEGQTATTTIDITDYKNVEGILIPHTLSVSGPLPQPMVMKATAVKINPQVDQSLFRI